MLLHLVPHPEINRGRFGGVLGAGEEQVTTASAPLFTRHATREEIQGGRSGELSSSPRVRPPFQIAA